MHAANSEGSESGVAPSSKRIFDYIREHKLYHRVLQVSDLPCNIRRWGGQCLVIGGPSLVILEGGGVNAL